MIDHEKHFTSILKDQKILASEIQELSNILTAKKEQFLKLQGIVEYLNANGITPEENEKVSEIEKGE
jgi:hypothetical protein